MNHDMDWLVGLSILACSIPCSGCKRSEAATESKEIGLSGMPTA
jgi:hypothetical protein